MNTEERQKFWEALCKADGNDIIADSKSILSTIKYPHYLYRYRPVSVSSIDALQTNHLFFSQANYYDDPFDTLIKIDYDVIHEHITQALSSKELFQNLESTCKALNIPDENRLDAEKIIKTVPTEEIVKNVDVFLKNNIQSILKNSLWTVCFSESGINETMWLKYADQYKGFCVIYDSYDFLDSKRMLCGKQEKCVNCVVNKAGVSLYPVYYSDNGYDATEYARNLSIAIIVRNKIPMLADKIIQSLPDASWEQERIALIKSKCHEYDQEWRSILRSPAKGPIMQEWIPYGIILGLRTNSRDRDIILKSAKMARIDHFFESYINDCNRLDIRSIQ